MATTRSSNADDLFIALGHPLRREILRETIAARDRELSPRELSSRLSQPLSKLSYHVRILAQCGALELAHTRQSRGSTQHFYRPTVDARWVRSALRQSAGRRHSEES